MSNFLPGYGDVCLCGSYYACRCPPEPDVNGRLDESYTAGYDACTVDGFDERPMTEWVYRSGYRCLSEHGPDGRPRLVHVMTELRFAELTWRRHNRTAHDYRRWFERQYGHDLAEYLAGYDDAGAGLPCAVREPERYRLFAAALDGYEPPPDLYEEPLGPWPEPVPVEGWLPL